MQHVASFLFFSFFTMFWVNKASLFLFCFLFSCVVPYFYDGGKALVCLKITIHRALWFGGRSRRRRRNPVRGNFPVEKSPGASFDAMQSANSALLFLSFLISSPTDTGVFFFFCFPLVHVFKIALLFYMEGENNVFFLFYLLFGVK